MVAFQGCLYSRVPLYMYITDILAREICHSYDTLWSCMGVIKSSHPLDWLLHLYLQEVSLIFNHRLQCLSQGFFWEGGKLRLPKIERGQ